jgi:tetratricopeptide (TPR) repeat protein
MTSKDRKPGDIVDDKFALIESCGCGNYGEVWKARHTQLNVYRALKFVNESLPVEVVLGEAQKQAKIVSDNVVKVHDVCIKGKYIDMDYHPHSLEKELKERVAKKMGPLGLDLALQIFEGCVQAVYDAHEQDIVHGDVKPGNILLDDNKKPLLADFGVARGIEEKGVPWLKGSSRWAAPEVLRGEQSRKSADFFSLGIVAYLLLTNTHPFYCPDPSCLITIADNIQNKEFPVEPLSNLRPDVPEWVHTVVTGFLSRDMSEREEAFKKAVAQIVEPPEEAVVACPNCQHMNDQVAKYCSNCGNALFAPGSEAMVRHIGEALSQANYQFFSLYKPKEALGTLSGTIVRYKKQKPPQLANLCSFKAFIHLNRGEHGLAEEAASQGIRIDFANVHCWHALARAQFLIARGLPPTLELPKLKEAQAAVEEALKLARPNTKKALDVQNLLDSIEKEIRDTTMLIGPAGSEESTS